MTERPTPLPLARAAASPPAQRPRAAAVLALALAAGTMASILAVPAAAGPTAPAPAVGIPSVSAPADAARVVVTALAGGVDNAAEAVRAAGGQVLDRLPLVGGVSATLPTGAVLAPSFVVAPDREVRVSSSGLADSGPVSTVRESVGLGAPDGEGAGTVIAVVDTGVQEVADLAGRVTHVDVSGAGVGDGYGHGTFVAGVAAGSGASSNGRYAGVAPGASILDVRVAGNDGSTDLITVLRGLEAAAVAEADVVNLSLSSYSPLPFQIDPLTVALRELWRRGATVVVPAGNDGPDARTITSPGTSPVLLTVGALDESGTGSRADDVVADFSARGPAPQGIAKPDLAAPGRSLVSLRAPGSLIDVENAHGRIAGSGDQYFRGSGTSFSTAATAGAAAVLHAERDVTPDQVKQLLTGTAYDADGLRDVTAAGAGGLDLRAALAAALPAAPAGKGKGMGGAGHDADLPGDPQEWQRLLRALVSEDPKQAAKSWAKLSPEAKAWAAESWAALPADLRAELVEQWAGRNWAGGSAEEWAGRNWAGRNWAGRNWAGRNWAGRNWAGRNWAGRNWAGDLTWLAGWEAGDWAGRNWAGRNWAGRNWAGRNWADQEWAGRNWAGRNWADQEWAGRNWAGRNWADQEWAGRNWAAVAWGS